MARDQPRARRLGGGESWWRSWGCSWLDTRAALEAPSLARACWLPEWKLCAFSVAAITHGWKHRGLMQHPLIMLPFCSFEFSHGPKSRCHPGTFLLEALGGNQFPDCFPASRRCWKTILGPWLPSFFKAESAVLLRSFLCHDSSLGNLSIYLSLVVLGFHCCTWVFSGCLGEGHSSFRCPGFSLRRLLLLWNTDSRTDRLQQL